ncbi:hypothetical protein K1F50_04105 [Muricauda oceani]|jgi:hypothetical protein|uniref:ATP-binding protein n=1 Tax=Flagellimonas oceani TaxID=2698672 RepID=A0A6G7J8W8_9FLAO|nr:MULTISPECIES: hypothetical protein [Allomuricauda]MAM17374.1 hypothetical protein [Christiangramia sp.]MBW8241970.1 hypothetical protein [Allomuricauda oceani]QII46882.1 hypothetical protein GVT53_20090 [Allomuricauda oceani]|tara:strand:+ start:14962 stop:16989 length:2028 start_codon:yes stop_codon:yes gene_type:complete
MIVPAENIVETVDLTADDVLLPMLECVVNSIISLQQSSLPANEKEIQIKIIRGALPSQTNLLDSVKTIDSFVITDNGIGFTDKNYRSFETPFSQANKEFGCKGIGRFTVLAAFESLKVESNYLENQVWKYREFEFNTKDEVNLITSEKSEEDVFKTKVRLDNCFNEVIRQKSALKIEDIAESVMQHCLIYYLNDSLPKIMIYDEESSRAESINDLYAKVSKEKERNFEVKKQQFKIYITKTPKEGNRKNNYVHYCANSRVVGNPKNIKNFNSLFNYPISRNGSLYFLDVYVVSEYLNRKSFSTRNGFNIPKEKENLLFANSSPLSFQEIEENLTKVLEDEYNEFVKKSRERSQEEIKSYIKEKAPRYRSFLKKPEVLNSIPPNLSEDKLEEHLYKISYTARKKVENHIDKFINEKQVNEETINQIKDDIKEKTAYDVDSLADYMTRRRAIIELFEKFLDADENGNYKLEEDVHNLIFPMGLTSNDVVYENHNLWLLDERFLNYKFIASDKSITSYSQKKSRKEADLVMIDNPQMFENPIGFGDKNSGEINSMVIFEFKRPGEVAHQKRKGNYRWEFSDLIEPYFDEFLYQQDKKNYKGNQVIVTKNTPKFGFIIVDVLPTNLKQFNEDKGWEKTPFGTYFKIIPKLNLNLEVMTFRKLLEVSRERHNAFFNKLFN